MTRTFLAACLLASFSGFSLSQTPATQKPKTEEQAKPLPNPSNDEENPPEEDESVMPEKFVLNPLESDRNIRVGNYYWHKGKYRAAAGRYTRATKYNPNSPEAFFKLGEAEEKLKNRDAARQAFQKVMALAPDSKLASEAKKKLGSKSS
ncbi:MAG: tetratricopeptide repeat protein [Bryobacteraceae bacterium]